MTHRARLDLLVGLALVAAGGAGLAWHVTSVELATAVEPGTDTTRLPALLCPLAPHLPPVADTPGDQV